MTWFVLQCAVGKEIEVEFDLLRLGLVAKCITYTRIKKHRRYKTKIEETKPLFSGYVFLKDEDVVWREVRDCPGVQGVLGVHRGHEDFSPIPISDEEMARVEGVAAMGVQISGTPKLQHFFSVGDKVRLVDGPFGGLGGVMVSKTSAHANVTVNKGDARLDVKVPLSNLEAR